MSAQLWTGGLRVTAERLSNMLHKFDDWTPEWTTTGADDTDYGNAAINCSYSQSGDLVVCHFEIVFGSTTNFGAGGTGDNWEFRLPVTASYTADAVGEMALQRANADRAYARVRINSTNVFVLEASTGRPSGVGLANTGVVDSVTPWAWASGNALRGQFEYEAA